MKALNPLLVFVLASFALSACVTTPAVGSKQAEVPPQIIVNKDGYKIWNNPSAFGPVPAELASAGQKACATLDTDKVKYEAKGYHAQAKDIDGNAFAEGGYYCVAKS